MAKKELSDATVEKKTRKPREKPKIIASGWDTIVEMSATSGRGLVNRFLKEDGNTILVMIQRDIEPTATEQTYAGNTRVRYAIPCVMADTGELANWVVGPRLVPVIVSLIGKTEPDTVFRITRHGKAKSLDTAYKIVVEPPKV
jgi:hypothetical protein